MQPGDWSGAGATFIATVAALSFAHYALTLRLWGLKYKFFQVDRLEGHVSEETCLGLKEEACYEHRRCIAMKNARRKQRKMLVEMAIEDYFSHIATLTKKEAVNELNKQLRKATSSRG